MVWVTTICLNRNVWGMFCSCCLLHKKFINSISKIFVYIIKYSKMVFTDLNIQKSWKCTQILMINVCNQKKKSNPPFPPKTKKGKQKTMTNGNNETSRKYIRGSTVTINGLFGIPWDERMKDECSTGLFFFFSLS